MLVASTATAGEISGNFARIWQDAGQDEAKKREVLDRLAGEKSADAAKLLVAVSLMPDEPGGIVDRAIVRLAELEGTDADAWMREELRHGGRWADRTVIARAIGRRKSEDARTLLFGALKDRSWQVQTAAIDGLRNHPSRETIDVLLETWAALDPKAEDSGRLAGDIRDTVLVITGKDFQTAADAKSWWSANQATWKPERGPSRPIESTESVTEERTPKLFDDISSRRVILVLDISASMRVETGSGRDAKHPAGLTRLEILKREVKRVVDDLPQGARFSIIVFGDRVLPWKPHLVSATESNKRNAVKFIDLLKPEGTTNSNGALEQAFKNPDADTFYFLSDGYPTVAPIDFNVILGNVTKWNVRRNIRIHTIAFVAGNGKRLGIVEDKGMAKEFMRRLAQENGGHYRLVE